MQWPDSMAMEADGRVCIATIFSGVVTIVDLRTGSFEEVAFPDPITTNVALGGVDRREGGRPGRRAVSSIGAAGRGPGSH